MFPRSFVSASRTPLQYFQTESCPGYERGMDFNVGTHMRDKQYK